MSVGTVFAHVWHLLTGGQVSRTNAIPSLDNLQQLAHSGSLCPYFRYRHFTRPKANGGHRHIFEPDENLKRLQRAIIQRYLCDQPVHPASMAYQPKKSIADHVWPHVGATMVITADIEDFFPNTSAIRVEQWWRERAENDAQALTLLTTHRGGLPQGAPTSPALSNLVNYAMDERLLSAARRAGACYTRYCDDMVLSFREAEPSSDFEQVIRGLLSEFGYKLHPKKGWKCYQRVDEPEITGVILSRFGGVRLPAEIRATMRDLARSRDPVDRMRLAGYKGYEEMIRRRKR